jgi:hypothetical protein
MVEMFMMIEEMNIQEGKYLEFAEMFKSMNINIDRLAGMRNQIVVNTYYQRHVRAQRASSNPRLTEAQKQNNSHYSLCNCGRYVSNVQAKFILKHLNTAVHYQGVRNRKYAHLVDTFNNEEINDKIKTEVVIQCFIIKHLIEVKKLTVAYEEEVEYHSQQIAEAIRIHEEEEAREMQERVEREMLEDGISLTRYSESESEFESEDEKEEETPSLETALMGCLEETLMRDEYWEENPHYQCEKCNKKCKCRMDFCQCDKFVEKSLNYCDEPEGKTICDECLELDEEEDTGEIYIGMPTVQMGLDMLSDETDEKEDEKEELSVAEEFRQGLLEPEDYSNFASCEELSVAEEFRRIRAQRLKKEKSKYLLRNIKVNDEIRFTYGDRKVWKGEIQGVIQKITKKTMIIAGHIWKKEKMNIIAIAVDEEEM